MLGSQGQGESRGRHSSEDDAYDESKMEGFQTVGNTRWAELMFSLQSIAKLQRAATRARIEARQKRREASFRREDVWLRDAKFMGEVQRLMAQGKLKGFEELSHLAAECQAAHDLLGPLEQDNIEAESRWQGQEWKLREAEEELYNEFEEQFRDAAEYAEAHGGEATSSHQSPSDSGSQSSDAEALEEQTAQTDSDSVPVIELDDAEAQELMPLDWGYTDTQKFETPASGSDLDSGIGDIESLLSWSPLQGKLPANKYGLPHALPKFQLYDELLEDFSTRRDRINRWLENTILESRLEGVSLFSILRDRLAAEDQEMPSNWSQLVIAYWELDDASVPKSDEGKQSNQNHHTPMVHPKSTETERESFESGTPTVVEIRPPTPSANTLDGYEINKEKPDINRGSKGFNGSKSTRLALHAPTLVLPSPNHSHSNCTPASFEGQGEEDPPDPP